MFKFIFFISSTKICSFPECSWILQWCIFTQSSLKMCWFSHNSGALSKHFSFSSLTSGSDSFVHWRWVHWRERTEATMEREERLKRAGGELWARPSQPQEVLLLQEPPTRSQTTGDGRSGSEDSVQSSPPPPRQHHPSGRILQSGSLRVAWEARERWDPSGGGIGSGAALHEHRVQTRHFGSEERVNAVKNGEEVGELQLLEDKNRTKLTVGEEWNNGGSSSLSVTTWAPPSCQDKLVMASLPVWPGNWMNSCLP